MKMVVFLKNFDHRIYYRASHVSANSVVNTFALKCSCCDNQYKKMNVLGRKMLNGGLYIGTTLFESIIFEDLM